MESDKVIIGMSGGVDSAVAALRLKARGYAVEGLFMKNWDDDDRTEYCTAAEDLISAAAAAEKIGIPLHTAHFAEEYRERVFAQFLSEHRAGRTPNPDVLCNREIKFQVFSDYARQLGAKYIATGHYCGVQHADNGAELLRGAAADKDQSYFLHAVPGRQLRDVIFPLDSVQQKQEVREQARRAGLKNHARKDSTGICFIGERRFAEFLARYLPPCPGEVTGIDGRVLGEHRGLWFYTLGQRRGIGVGGRRDSGEMAWYVQEKDLKNNRLIVVQGENHPALFSGKLRTTEQVHWVAGRPPPLPLSATAKIRYRQRDQRCEVSPLGENSLCVTFEKAQRAVTPGQSVVFYNGEICLGGAIIDKSL